MNENILQEVIEYKYAIQAQLEKLEKFLNLRPNESLQISTKNSYTRYFVKKESEISYLNKNDLRMNDLIHQRLAKDAIKNLQKNLNAANSFINKYSGKDLTDIAESYPLEMQFLLKDVIQPFSLKIKIWKDVKHPTNTLKPELLIYDTDSGQKVRSKSEVLIANALYAENIPFKYECPLKLKPSGTTVFPDFTVVSLKHHKLFYWEHAGMLDNANYAIDFCEKINKYTMSEITCGNNLIITTETSKTPLSVKTINSIIRSLLK